MSTPYLGEIRLFPYARVPEGWQRCDGTLLTVADNDALYALLGTTYGGDGVNTFAVPDLRGSVPIHQGSSSGTSNYSLGQKGGTEQVMLTTAQMAQHAHLLAVSDAPATEISASGTVPAQTPDGTGMYFNPPGSATPAAMRGTAVQAAGGSLPHDNCMPTLTITPCIATVGVYPSQN